MSLFQNFIYKLARKGLDTNVFMSTYALISKFHIQAPKTGEWWEGKGVGREGRGKDWNSGRKQGGRGKEGDWIGREGVEYYSWISGRPTDR